MKILKTPWKKELFELVNGSRSSIQITSPFLKQNICSELLRHKVPRTKFELITSFKLMSVYSGFIELSAIETILKEDGVVKNHPRLHSKIYLFDRKIAVITSSNLTHGGLLSNFEYGILLNDQPLVSQIGKDFDSLSNDERTGSIRESDLEIVEAMLEKISKRTQIKPPAFQIRPSEEPLDVIETDIEPIRNSITGWRRDVFECVESIPKGTFSLTDVYGFEAQLQVKHIKNKYIKDKIRQQLQELRDLGLIEFLGSGKYRKLWKSQVTR